MTAIRAFQPSAFQNDAFQTANSINVRIFGYRGLRQLPEAGRPTYLNATPPLRVIEPYEWTQILRTNGGTPVTSRPIVPDLSTFLKIEVPDGYTIQYEINNKKVTVNSPELSGTQIVQWNVGWMLSVVLSGILFLSHRTFQADTFQSNAFQL